MIHCADIHLGSALTSRFGKDNALKRKGELRLAFSAMVDYAREENIPVILLSGDVFDALSFIVHADKAYPRARGMCE